MKEKHRVPKKFVTEAVTNVGGSEGLRSLGRIAWGGSIEQSSKRWVQANQTKGICIQMACDRMGNLPLENVQKYTVYGAERKADGRKWSLRSRQQSGHAGSHRV